MGTSKTPQRAESFSAVSAASKAEAEAEAPTRVNMREANLPAEDAAESNANTLTQFPWTASAALLRQNNSTGLSLFILPPAFLPLRQREAREHRRRGETHAGGAC